MNPELVAFEWSHLAKLQFREYDRMGFMAAPDPKVELQLYLDAGIAFSGLVGDKTIMIGGVCVGMPKVGFAWLLTSNLVKEYPKFFHRSCLEIIEKGIKQYDLHRLDTTILEGHQVSIDWAERIGFEHECLMKKYDTDGNNYHLFAKVM